MFYKHVVQMGFTHSFGSVWGQIHKEFPVLQKVPKDTFTLYSITILVPVLQFT